MKKSLFAMLTNLPIEEIEWVLEQGTAFIKKNKKDKPMSEKKKEWRKEYEAYFMKFK